MEQRSDTHWQVDNSQAEVDGGTDRLLEGQGNRRAVAVKNDSPVDGVVAMDAVGTADRDCAWEVGWLVSERAEGTDTEAVETWPAR